MKLPKETLQQTAQLLARRHAADLKPGEEFDVDVDIDSEQVEVTFHLDVAGGKERIEVVCRVPIPAAAVDAEAGFALGIDAADAFLGQWLEGDREERFPIDFIEAEFEGKTVGVRMRKSRPSVEAEADRLLEDD